MLIIVKIIYNTPIISVFQWSVWYLTLYQYVKSLSLSIKKAQGFRVVCDDNFDWWLFWISVLSSAVVLSFFGRELYIRIYNTLVNIKAWFSTCIFKFYWPENYFHLVLSSNSCHVIRHALWFIQLVLILDSN